MNSVTDVQNEANRPGKSHTGTPSAGSRRIDGLNGRHQRGGRRNHPPAARRRQPGQDGADPVESLIPLPKWISSPNRPRPIAPSSFVAHDDRVPDSGAAR